MCVADKHTLAASQSHGKNYTEILRLPVFSGQYEIPMPGTAEPTPVDLNTEDQLRRSALRSLPPALENSRKSFRCASHSQFSSSPGARRLPFVRNAAAPQDSCAFYAFITPPRLISNYKVQSSFVLLCLLIRVLFMM